VCSPSRANAGGPGKLKDQPHEPESPNAIGQFRKCTTMRRQDEGRDTMSMPGASGPHALSFARRSEPRGSKRQGQR
jgi:hypothetical protein